MGLSLSVPLSHTDFPTKAHAASFPSSMVLINCLPNYLAEKLNILGIKTICMVGLEFANLILTGSELIIT